MGIAGTLAPGKVTPKKGNQTSVSESGASRSSPPPLALQSTHPLADRVQLQNPGTGKRMRRTFEGCRALVLEKIFELKAFPAWRHFPRDVSSDVKQAGGWGKMRESIDGAPDFLEMARAKGLDTSVLLRPAPISHPRLPRFGQNTFELEELLIGMAMATGKVPSQPELSNHAVSLLRVRGGAAFVTELLSRDDVKLRLAEAGKEELAPAVRVRRDKEECKQLVMEKMFKARSFPTWRRISPDELNDILFAVGGLAEMREIIAQSPDFIEMAQRKGLDPEKLLRRKVKKYHRRSFFNRNTAQAEAAIVGWVLANKTVPRKRELPKQVEGMAQRRGGYKAFIKRVLEKPAVKLKLASAGIDPEKIWNRQKAFTKQYCERNAQIAECVANYVYAHKKLPEKHDLPPRIYSSIQKRGFWSALVISISLERLVSLYWERDRRFPTAGELPREFSGFIASAYKPIAAFMAEYALKKGSLPHPSEFPPEFLAAFPKESGCHTLLLAMCIESIMGLSISKEHKLAGKSDLPPQLLPFIGPYAKSARSEIEPQVRAIDLEIESLTDAIDAAREESGSLGFRGAADAIRLLSDERRQLRDQKETLTRFLTALERLEQEGIANTAAGESA